MDGFLLIQQPQLALRGAQRTPLSIYESSVMEKVTTTLTWAPPVSRLKSLARTF
jgi:hypothetical protein